MKHAVVLLAFLAGSPLAFAADGPVEWLAKADAAMRDYELDGELVYIHDGRVETLRVERTNGPNGVREHLFTLNGERREIVREGSEIRSTQQGLSTVVDALPVLQLLSSATTASPYYAMRVIGQDRVAGRDAVVVEARPRDAVRYGYRLWLDKDTGMLLASSLHASNGAPIEQVMFTSIEMRRTQDIAGAGPAGPDTPPVETAGIDPRAPGVVSGPREPADWHIAGMPEGFRLVATPQTDHGPRHLVYSDGLASVSVYIEPLASSGPPLVASEQRGAVHLVGRTIDGHQIVVVGDLPAPSIERIATSVVRR